MSTARQRSFFRTLIPFRFSGSGAPLTLLRQGFIRHESVLLPRLFGTLEAVPLPALPRMMFAEAFQMMLSDRYPPRDVRAMFVDSGMEARRFLNDDDNNPDAQDPVLRLIALELMAAASFYESLLSITSTPWRSAAIAARTVISSDVRMDKILIQASVEFSDLPRDIITGERPPSQLHDTFAAECLLLERDTFGKHRLDLRGPKRFLMHCLDVEMIEKNDQSLSFMKDPVMKTYGNFNLESQLIHQGRWMEYRLRCGEEDTRVDSSLPPTEFVESQPSGSFSFYFDTPVCERMMSTHSSESVKECATDTPYEQVFELAVPETNLTFVEKWFRTR